MGVWRYWKTCPGVHQAKSFAHHRENIACVSPPVIGVEWIIGGGVNHQHRIAACQLPEARLSNGERVRASDFRQWLFELAEKAE